MKTANLIKYSVIVFLFVLPFVMWGVRKCNTHKIEMWYTFPVEDASVQIVPTPADTQGAFGLNACISADGTKVAIAGHKIGSILHDEPAFCRGVDMSAPMENQEDVKRFLKNIYWAGTETARPDFRQIDKN